MFHTFGCRTYVHNVQQRCQNKLSLKATPMIFVGYEPGVKGYRFWNNQQIVIAQDVVFEENTFPCRSKDSLSKQPEFGDLNEPLQDFNSPFEELGDFETNKPNGGDDDYKGT